MTATCYTFSLAIFIIIAYMLSALTWWTFALIRSQEKIYEKEISTIEIKRELAVEYAVEWLLLKDSEHSKSSPLAIHKHIYHNLLYIGSLLNL